MGGNKTKKATKETKKYTLEMYIEGMKYPEFYFSPIADWIPCHGDGKATTKDNWRAETQATSAAITIYKVRVLRTKDKLILLERQIKVGGTRPSDEEVLAVLRAEIDG